jgi:hypothetical protein
VPIFSSNNSPAIANAPVIPWQDCYPAWAAVGLIPLRAPGEVFTAANGQQVTATGKEPIHNVWQTIPAQRQAVKESQFETFNDIAHEIQRGRNIGMVIPDNTVCLDLDNPGLVDSVLALYPDAPAQLTQSGGLHLFFRTNPGEEFSATRKVEIDGIVYDIRSAGRSQVACFPSTGLKGKYRWLRPLPIDRDTLPLRPDALLKYLANNRTGTPATHREYGPMPINPPKPKAEAYKVIKEVDENLYKRIVNNQPLTNEVGARNNYMVRVVGMFLGLCTPPGEAPSPELAFAALLPSIMADTSGDAHNPPPSPAELWSACCRLCDAETATWLENQSILGVVNKVLYEQRVQAEQDADAIKRGLAETMNVSPEELKKQAILYLPNGHHYYVLNEKIGGYAGPTSSNGLLQRITEGCPHVFSQADLYDINQSGQITLRPVSFLLRDFGKPITRIDRKAGLDVPIYNRRDETMVMGVWQLRNLEPAFNEKIDHWLRLLAGDEYDALSAWLATVTNTERPNSCLYIKGPKAIGKSLLVDGLARLWGRKAVRYRDVMARFNDSFLKCPLVHLDEGLSDHTDSLRFREFISETEHVIETKGQPQYTLQGSARVIVTSNNANALKIQEALNTDDIDAISSRISWISTGSEAAQYLKRLHGRQTTTEWVEDDLIARHVLWLKQTVEVETEGHENRFLVPGNFNMEKLQMLRTYRSNSTLFEVVANYVIEAATAKNGHYTKYEEGVLFTEGTVAIRWKGLAEYWNLNETRFGKVPSPRDAASSLKIFSRETEKSKRTTMGPRKFYIADYELLMDEIERAAPDELVKAIEDFLHLSIDDQRSRG